MGRRIGVSAWRRWRYVELSRLCEQAGGSPAASHFLLLRQKKVTKEKASRSQGHCAALRGSLRCSDEPEISETCLLRSLRTSEILIRLLLCCSALPERHCGSGTKYGIGLRRTHRVLLPEPDSVFFLQTRPGWAEQRRWRRKVGPNLFEPQASCLDRRRNRAAQVARSAAKGPRLRVAFLSVRFLWRDKER